MSDDGTDDDSSDRDRRFEHLSATDETSADETATDDSASDDEVPDAGEQQHASSDPSQDIDAWEWTEPETVESGSNDERDPDTFESRFTTDPGDSETGGADRVPTQTDPPNTTAPLDDNKSNAGAHDRSPDDSAEAGDSEGRRTRDRIWNRSAETRERAETTAMTAESPSKTTPADAESGSALSEETETASSSAEDSTMSEKTDMTASALDPASDATDTPAPEPSSSTTTPDDADTESAFSAGSTDGDAGAPETESPVSGLDPIPGTSILLQCGSQDDREDAACHDLLGLTEDSGEQNVLLIQYRRVAPERLEHIATHAKQMTVVAVGYSQPVPESVEDQVETVEINNPNDITRLGILVSGTLDDWADDDATTVVCYDSVNVLLEYKDVQNTFRFLHVFLGTLESADAIAHFHADPLAGTPQKINTLKPLFDDVVSIDSMGVNLE